jgi:hypothetical protein
VLDWYRQAAITGPAGCCGCPGESQGWLCLVTDGVLLESSGHLLISSTLKNFQLLTILVVKEEDLGTYTCCVSNPLGTAVTTGVLRKAGVCSTPEVSTRP